MGVFWVGQDVGYVSDFGLKQSSPNNCSPARLPWKGLRVFSIVGWKAVIGGVVISRVFLARDGGHVGLAQSRRRFGQRIQHGLEVKGRAADDLEYVGGGGLLLQRFAQLVEQPR